MVALGIVHLYSPRCLFLVREKETKMSDWDFLHEMHDRGFSTADIADAAGCGYAPWEAVHIAEQETKDALKELQSLRSAQEISREEFLKAREKILGHRSV